MSSSLLTAAGAAPPLRSASAMVANAARGFHVFRIDGYSVTTTIPAGERLTSQPFYVGGRCWFVDYYPNGTDGSATTDSGDIAVYLRMQGTQKKERVRAEYKLSLLDPAGTAAYELPAETAIFSSPGSTAAGYGNVDVAAVADPGYGYASFITKEDLGKRREILLKEDSLAIRCDVAVAQVAPPPVAPPVRKRVAGRGRGRGRGGRFGGCDGGYNGGYYNGGIYDDGYELPDDEFDGSLEGGGSGHAPQDDKEFIRQCLAQRRNYY